MEDYYVVEPFDVYRQSEFTKEVREELKRKGRRVIAIVFNCKDYEDFSRKYFGK